MELKCGGNPGCNIWEHCPEEQCFAFDIHVHTKGECWLKQQRSPDGATNLTRPKDVHEGHTTFPAAMRKSPRKVWPWAVDPKIWAGGIPEHVPWIPGVLASPTPSCAARPPTTNGGSGGATSTGRRTAMRLKIVCLLTSRLRRTERRYPSNIVQKHRRQRRVLDGRRERRGDAPRARAEASALRRPRGDARPGAAAAARPAVKAASRTCVLSGRAFHAETLAGGTGVQSERLRVRTTKACVFAFSRCAIARW